MGVGCLRHRNGSGNVASCFDTAEYAVDDHADEYLIHAGGEIL
jgi:hypothetical protein